MKFIWGANLNELSSSEDENERIRVCELYAIWDKEGNGKAQLDGKSISNAYADYDESGRPAVFMTMDSESGGIATWGEMTTEAANDQQRPIAVVMDDLCVLCSKCRRSDYDRFFKNPNGEDWRA